MDLSSAQRVRTARQVDAPGHDHSAPATAGIDVGRLGLTRDPIKSAARTLEVLQLFQEQRTPLRLKSIFQRLSYPQSSTTTLLKSLVVLGYLNYDRPSRTYFPTPRVAALGDWINHYLYGAGDVFDAMEFVLRETEETVVLSSQNDVFVQHIRVMQPAHEFKLPPAEGSLR